MQDLVQDAAGLRPAEPGARALQPGSCGLGLTLAVALLPARDQRRVAQAQLLLLLAWTDR